jgi:RNA polymerase sigma-70 factor (ECF subfamily)
MYSNIDETTLLVSLRKGDEKVFESLIEKYHASLVRLAGLFVHEDAVAEELAQDTWLAVLQGLDRFEGRSSFKTWLFTILTNKAKTRSRRDRRFIVVSDMDETTSDSSTVDADRFYSSLVNKNTGHWASGADPNSWEDLPEATLASKETMSLITQIIESLPENQRLVITLRDVNEIPSNEVCSMLGISETNQRVLLHRARARVRQALEDKFRLEY